MKTKGRAKVEKSFKTLERLDVVYVNVSELTPNAYNPNRQSEHDFELLQRSMTEDGFTQPIIVRKSDMMIVDGEHRWRAGRELGYDEVPVVFVEFTDEQMRISTLRHNRARGSEDIALSAEVLRDLEKLGALEWAQDSLMMDDTEINVLLSDIAAPEALAGEEWNEGWDPSSTQVDGPGTQLQKDMSVTAEASDRQREVEEKIREAKTEDEKQMARRELDTHRVVAVFSGDQAAIIKQALGKQQAERILHLCTKAVEEGDIPE
jgi:hypothetical protein